VQPFLLFFRAAYKLRGKEARLNFPLTAAEKAELDAMTVFRYLAKVQVEKSSASGSAPLGCLDSWGLQEAGIWVTYASDEFFATELEAAAEYDRVAIARAGPAAMTNAKYHGGPETRKRAWEEREQALEERREERE